MNNDGEIHFYDKNQKKPIHLLKTNYPLLTIEKVNGNFYTGGIDNIISEFNLKTLKLIE